MRGDFLSLGSKNSKSGGKSRKPGAILDVDSDIFLYSTNNNGIG